MIVYRDIVRTATTADCLRTLRRFAVEGRPADFLVELGRLEQGAADARHPERDDWTADDDRLRAAALAAGRALIAPGPRDALRAMDSALAGLEAQRDRLPRVLALREPEGYTHYALDPRAYHASARAYQRAVGERARLAAVVGIRSIGTSLSAVVAASLGAPVSLTVRVRGESGRRRVRATERLCARVRTAADDGGDALIVDEGPGVTGETFECTAAWLREIGVPDARMVLFPSHDGAMPLAPASRRSWFRAARRHLPPLEDGRLAAIAAELGRSPPVELSAGAWRRVVAGAAGLPAVPHFERLKARLPGDTGAGTMLRYAGLGAALDRWLDRAAELAEGGLAAWTAGDATSAGHGFVARPWLEGRPLRRRRGRSADTRLRGVMAGYIAARAGRFGTGRVVDVGHWVRVLLENGAEAGAPSPALTAAARAVEALREREAVIPDGRLQPWEWIGTPDGRIVKVDAVDHGDGLRLPGPADPAWDVAGAIIELELDHPAADEFLESCGPSAGLIGREAVGAYRPVYAAACFGDAELAAREVADPAEAVRLRREAAFYARALAASLGS